MKNIFRELKGTLIITSVLTLLPLFAGLLLWNVLPDVLVTHWGIDNQPNGWSSKAMEVYGIPLIMLAMQWFMLFVSELDLKKKNHSMKLMQLALWIIPMMTLLVSAMCYAYALGIELNTGFWALFFLGALFTIIGNYLPKCKQNYTIGIKIPWTLSNEENWNKTHRLAGRLWVICGIVIMLSGFFGLIWIVISALVIMCLLPFVYSYILYRKGM